MDIEKKYKLIGRMISYDGLPMTLATAVEKLNTLERFETGFGGCCWTCETVAEQNLKLREEIKALPQ